MLADAAKARAFTVAWVTSADVLQDVQDALTAAIQSGETFGDFQKRIGGIMQQRGWAGSTDWHLETVYRTNMQSAYGRGRYEEQREMADVFPFWRYIATQDQRTRPSHAALDGEIRSADDPFWRVHYPPWGYNCRCSVEALMADEVDLSRVATGPGPGAEGGFVTPVQGSWSADLSRYDGWIARLLADKIGA